MSKSVKKIWNIFTTVIVGIIVVLALLLVGVRAAGLTPYAVLSGSMEPTYHVGAIIYVKDAAAGDVNVGDAITFRLEGSSTLVTHRVTEIDEEQQCFYTKGDANDAPDASPVSFGRLVGIPVFTIPYLGYVSSWISGSSGLYIGIAAAVILLLVFVPDIAGAVKKAKKEQAQPHS